VVQILPFANLTEINNSTDIWEKYSLAYPLPLLASEVTSPNLENTSIQSTKLVQKEYGGGEKEKAKCEHKERKKCT
jgi:hypothetical protein